MPDQTRRLDPLPRFASEEASLYVAQLDDLTRRLRDDIKDATTQQLEWQPAPGMNTAGMLLAHIAIAEVFWASVLAEEKFDCEAVLGMGADDDGMPCPEGGAPPPGLAGKPIDHFFGLIRTGREYTRAKVAPLRREGLTRDIRHERRDGIQTLNGHWILYHMVEHMAGHCGQIRMLLHLQRAGVASTAGSN